MSHSVYWKTPEMPHQVKKTAISRTLNLLNGLPLVSSFNQANKKARFDVDHSVLGSSGITGATPIGRGTTKNPKKRSMKQLAYK
jgi:hypothetical protein